MRFQQFFLYNYTPKGDSREKRLIQVDVLRKGYGPSKLLAYSSLPWEEW